MCTYTIKFMYVCMYTFKVCFYEDKNKRISYYVMNLKKSVSVESKAPPFTYKRFTLLIQYNTTRYIHTYSSM